MENTKEEISFSVNLSASKNIQEKDMKLTFFGEEKPLLFDEEFNLLPSITKTMQMSKYGQNISNIIDVLPNSEKYNMNDFIGLNVVLFEEKDSENPQRAKNGYLIGISKDNKAYIIGLWPYSFYQQIKGKFRDCIDRLKKIINNPANIEELLLLSQK